MSNHGASYMLNSVLLLLEKYNFFNNLAQEKIIEFANDIVKIGNYHDCNNGEIFHEIGKRLKYCYYCENFAEEFDESEYGTCKACAQE